jgi:glycine/D-amino acid oxidase-like deaminating enzyme
MQTHRTEVVIAGVGVIGFSTVYCIAGAVVKVLIIERDSLGSHASLGAPGASAPRLRENNLKAANHQCDIARVLISQS